MERTPSGPNPRTPRGVGARPHSPSTHPGPTHPTHPAPLRQAFPLHNGEVLALVPGAGGAYLLSGGADFQVSAKQAHLHGCMAAWWHGRMGICMQGGCQLQAWGSQVAAAPPSC